MPTAATTPMSFQVALVLVLYVAGTPGVRAATHDKNMPPLADIKAPSECARPPLNTLSSFCFGACKSVNQLCVNYAAPPANDTRKVGDGNYYYQGCAFADMPSCITGVGDKGCELQCLQMNNKQNLEWVLDISQPQKDKPETSLFQRVEQLVLPDTLKNLSLVGTTELTRKVPVSFVDSAFAQGEGLERISFLDIAVPEINSNIFPSGLKHLTIRRAKLKQFDPRGDRPFSGLHFLDLSENSLTDIPAMVFELKNLSELHMAENNLSSIHLTSPQYTFLEKLDVFEAKLAVNGNCRDGYKQVTLGKVGSVCYTGKDLMSEKIDSGSHNGTTSKMADSSSPTTVIFIVVGLAVFVAAAVIAGVFFLKKTKRCVHEHESISCDKTGTPPPRTTLAVDYRQLSNSGAFDDGVLPMRKATFKEIPPSDVGIVKTVAQHGAVNVYLAEYGKSLVYVNKLKLSDDLAEVAEASSAILPVVAQLRHPQMLTIVGFMWDDANTMNALCEYMNLGTLEEYLLSSAKQLTWANFKLSAAAMVAECLMYLHGQRKQTYDGLNGHSVLVDSEKGCKLNTFLASVPSSMIHKQSSDANRVFFAPEIVKGEEARAASDMYAFGVLLVQLDSCERAPDMIRNSWRVRSMDSGSTLTDSFKDATEPVSTSLMSLFTFTEDCPEVVRQLAHVCLEYDPSLRPSASYIAAMLRQQTP